MNDDSDATEKIVEDTGREKEERPLPSEAPVRPEEGEAAGEQSSYVYPDGGSASSQRARLVPPKGKRVQWRERYGRELAAAEWGLTALFFLMALYFLYLLVFWGSVYVCRPEASWRMPSPEGRWRAIVVHHTATERGSPESIDRFHREVRKWEGLGYHFLIGNGRSNGRDPTLGDGEVHVGVRWHEQRGGAHVRMRDIRDANSFSIGIALIGNFEETEPTGNQVAALRCLLGVLMDEYGIGGGAVYGHGEVSEAHTLCPGRKLRLREIVATLPKKQ